jgi:hypothetical protein
VLKVSRRFRWTRLYFQDRRISQACFLPASCSLRACLILRPWLWRWHVPPKRRMIINVLHGLLSQKITLFTVINFRVSWKYGISWSAEWLLASPKIVICCVEVMTAVKYCRARSVPCIGGSDGARSLRNTIYFSRRIQLRGVSYVNYYLSKVKVKLSLYRPWRPLGLREVEAPTFSDIRLTDGGIVVSPTRQPLFTPRKVPGTHFC